MTPLDVSNLQKLRKQFLNHTTLLMNTESGKAEEFLQLKPVINLAADFRKKLPVAVVEGDEGSRKTCMFLQIIRNREWKTFVAYTGTEEFEMFRGTER